MKPVYQIVGQNENVIFLVDRCTSVEGAMSITNAAEIVTKELFNKFGDKHFVYQDTDDQWDELVHTDGMFIGFSEYTT